MQNTTKAIWFKFYSIADLLSNTSISLLDTKYMFDFGQSTIIQFFIECLTEKGLLLRNSTSESHTKFMDYFFAGIEPEKIAVFVRVLDAMIDFLQGDGKQHLVE